MTWTEPRRAQASLLFDVAPLQEAFIASGLTASEVGRRMGWFRPDRCSSNGPYPDQSRVKRTLGLRPYNPGKGYPNRLRSRITYEHAAQLAEAMNVDPYEVGL